MFRGRGLDVAGFDLEPHAAEIKPNFEPNRLIADIRNLPFENSLFIPSMQRLPQIWLRHAQYLLDPRFRNAGLFFWELPVVPPAWVPSLRMFDVVLTCSHYVRQAFETAVPEVPTVHAEHPLPVGSVDTDRAATRRKYAIPQDSTVFCCGFDPTSGFARKNPIGGIAAWLKAFPTRRDVCLVVKANGPVVSGDARAIDVVNRIEHDPRIVLISDRLSHAEVMRLYDCCDVFVSLHRSEGLGLVPMEAMALGKVVIATGYSGNMTYMTEQNSLPVAYRLVEPHETTIYHQERSFAGSNARWAEPDLDQAAGYMQRIVDDPALFEPLAEQARQDIRRRQETAWQGRFVDDMLRLMKASTRSALRPGLRRQVLAQELLSPALFRKNVEAVWRRVKRD